jgi:hypothetical protein
MEERKNKWKKIKAELDDFSYWLGVTLEDSKKFTPEQKVEFIQREPKDLGLGDGWIVHIDINRFVEGAWKVSRFATVYGADKFEAMTNASAITRIEKI